MVEQLLETAVRAARRGGRVLRRYFEARSDLEIRSKGEHDFVTSADRESEAAVIAEIRSRFPGHHILAEEGGRWPGSKSEFEWLIDPLDGTTNFVQGLPYFAVSVACRRGESLVAGAVLDPQGGNLFTAGRGLGAHWNERPIRVSEHPGLDAAYLATGYPFRAREALDLYLDVFRGVFLRAKAIRRCGAAALDLAYAAAGVYDGFFEFRLSPWDIAAGALLIEEAGGVVSDVDGGRRFLESGNVVAGPAAVQRQLLETIGQHADEAALLAADETRNKRPREVVG